MKKRFRIPRTYAAAAILAWALSAFACGVKGPPLPPVADTPAASDRAEVSAAPSPKPSPSPTARKKTKGKPAGR